MKKAIFSLIISALIILPFGNILAVGTDYRYTGKPYDANINLYYYGQRYYDPMAGRFTQPDPVSNYLTDPQKLKQSTGQDLQKLLQNPQALNSYNYVQNNPVKYIDPDGEYIAPYDSTTDVLFFGQSLDAYNDDKNWVNGTALALDAIGLALPIIPAGTGLVFKGIVKGANYLSDAYKASRLLTKFRVGAEVINKIIDSADNAYEVAKNGGKHFGGYKNYLDRTDEQLIDSIESHLDNVVEHIDKLKNPDKHIVNFSQRTEEYVAGQIKQWKNHLLNNQEQANIKSGILKARELEN